MMNRIHFFITGLALLAVSFLFAQDPKNYFNSKEAGRIEKVLASDEMRGRRAFSPDIDLAAAFIADEFKSAGLLTLPGDNDFFQEFRMARPRSQDTTQLPLANVVGIVPGKSKKNEYVIFSAHYDHLGIRRPVEGDSIYNGANDNASGTTAVIMLAKYFAAVKNNERTLVFVAFTAEEMGGFGSRHFSQQLNPEAVTAMINIEMIGTESKWGKNSAFITGFDKSSLGSILQNNLQGTGFRFYPDPYPDQQLFYRSDNATLARLGVPAHTISTAKMDQEVHYHKATDHVETLDMENMAGIIQSIALSARSIINGKETPTRVKTADLR